MSGIVLGENLLDGHPLFEKIGKCGDGAQGEVFFARRRSDGTIVALKYLNAGTQNMEKNKYIIREVYNHMKLTQHGHIVVMDDFSLHRGYILLHLEAATGGNLYTYLAQQITSRDFNSSQGVQEDFALFFFRQIVAAVYYSHRKEICNRDIKLENVLLFLSDKHPNTRVAKLCDFGLSKDCGEDSVPASVVGTAYYCPPEIAKGYAMSHPSPSYDGYKTDAWGLGVMLYKMLTWRFPFEESSDRSNRNGRLMFATVLGRISNDNYNWSFPEHLNLSDGVKDLITKLLTNDPSERLSVEGIVGHPWFASWENYDEKLVNYTAEVIAKDGSLPAQEWYRRMRKKARDIFEELGWGELASLGSSTSSAYETQ